MGDIINKTTNGHSGRHLNGVDPQDEFLQKYRLGARPSSRASKDTASLGSRDSSYDRSQSSSVSRLGSAALEAVPAAISNGARNSRAGSADSRNSSGHQPGGSTPKTCYAKHSVTTTRKGRELPPFPNRLTKGGESGDGVRDGTPLELPSRQPTGSGTGTARHKVSKAGASSIPDAEITIPNDGCLASFSTDAMANFFRHMRLDDRLVSHLHRNGLDGRKFGRLKDTDLDNLRLNNPVIVYFRDRTAPVANKKTKQRVPFVL